MPYPEIRSIRVDGLPPTRDAIYLFSCFHDNAKVLAATVVRHWNGVPLDDRGFVEFASREDAEFVLKSYNGERMPNLSPEKRFRLSWDTRGFGTMWRWDYFYRTCSFFGYDEDGNDLDANTVIMDSSPPSDLVKKRPYLQSACPYPWGDSGEAYTENQLDHAKSNGLSPACYMETATSKRLKPVGFLLTDPNMDQQGLTLAISHYQPDLMQLDAAAEVDQPPYEQLQTQWVGGCRAAYDTQPLYQQLQAQWLGDSGATLLFQLPHPRLKSPYNIGSDAHTVGKLTQVCKGDLKVVSSMKKEKELYLCFEEAISGQNCYVFRTIKLSELLACSCKFSSKARKMDKCDHCARNTKPESQLRLRAWLFTGVPLPTSCGDKEEIFPNSMDCLDYGSQMFFAGGLVPSPDAVVTGKLVPSGDVYKFEAESTSWQKLDWSFQKAKPCPLFFEVNGNLYCLTTRHICGGPLEHPNFEVYESSSRECLALPEPHVDLPGLKDGLSLKDYWGAHKLACAVVGTKILISIPGTMMQSASSPRIPIFCFDVNDKERKWRVMTSLFDGKPFPFDGRALVLGTNGAHVMFSFRDKRFIFVSLLEVDDDNGDISISDDMYMGSANLVSTLMDNVIPLSYAFVDLGNQNVAFVLCGNICSAGKRNATFLGKVRVVVVVMHYQVLPSPQYLTVEILATRTFEYNCRSPYVQYTHLTGGLVV